MTQFLKKYSAFIIGAVITIVLMLLLRLTAVIKIDPEAWFENTLLFIFWWLVISFSLYKFSYIKNKKQLAIKILMLLVILIVMIAIDSIFAIRDNPVTITLLVVFWLGVTYVIFPGFFKKYKVPILIVYGLVLSYFLYARFGNQYFEIHKERIVSLLFIPIPFFIGLWIFEQWKWVQSLENDKKEAELALLKSQMNPHFFFNTLNNLYGLTVEKSDQAPDIVLKLSDMMRYTIYEGKEDVVLLKNEFTYLQNYIDLHKIRYQKKVKLDFDHEIDETIKVAPLLFIVLLENAFKHGVDSIAEAAYIHMYLKGTKDRIVFEIENNFELNKSHKDHGIGLENLRHRLNLIYPNRHMFTIQKENNIFRVRLEIDLI